MKRHTVFKYIDFIYICVQGWTLEASGKVWEQKKCKINIHRCGNLSCGWCCIRLLEHSIRVKGLG